MDIYKVINDLCQSESFVQEDMEVTTEIDRVMESYNQLPTMHENLAMPAEQVPVYEFSQPPVSYGDPCTCKYGVGADIFSIFMERNGFKDISEAMTAIADVNGVDASSIAVVFESAEDMLQEINEAKREKNPRAKHAKLKKLRRLGYLVDDMKTGKVKAVKEPGVKQIADNSENKFNASLTEPIGNGHDPYNRDFRF